MICLGMREGVECYWVMGGWNLRKARPLIKRGAGQGGEAVGNDVPGPVGTEGARPTNRVKDISS